MIYTNFLLNPKLNGVLAILYLMIRVVHLNNHKSDFFLFTTKRYIAPIHILSIRLIFIKKTQNNTISCQEIRKKQ